jgi:hypothetical protein
VTAATVATEVAGLLVQRVEHGSECARIGLQAGDRILAIDGLVPRDVIDVQFELPTARRLTGTDRRCRRAHAR